MKALSLHGPWAFYERKAAENECRISELEAEVRRWKLAVEDLELKLGSAQADSMRLQGSELPTLRADKERLHGMVESLQAELAKTRLERTHEQGALTSQVETLTAELQKLSADNAVLRSELAKTVHQKQITNSKLDQIRRKLGLSESEAKAFVQELDDARAAVKTMREENTQLSTDNSHLKQQVESRSAHCMTLIGDNKRLLEQVADLRMQLQKQQGELWQAKTEQVAASQRLQQGVQTKKAPQVVVREWPSGPASGASPSAPSSVRADQNRPPWADGGGSKAAGASNAGGGVATARAQKTVKNVPIGASFPQDADVVKASLIRQALAVRQQKVGAAPRNS